MKNFPLRELQTSSNTHGAKLAVCDKAAKPTSSAATTIGKSVANNLATLTDKDLLTLCRKYGTRAILWKRKFIGLLPEVDRRELYLKKRCSSIYEFAAKFGGVTKKHTQRVIQIDKAFEEKGVKVLREMLQEGAVGINKLAKIVSVIGMTEEKELVAAIKKLSCRTLETYVVDLRRAFGNCENIGGVRIENGHTEAKRRYSSEHDDNGIKLNDGMRTENGLFEPLFEGQSVHVNTFAKGVVKMQDQGVALKKLKLNLSEKMLDELLELQSRGINIDDLLREFLQNREVEIAEKKEGISKNVACKESEKLAAGGEVSRYISVKTRRILKEEYGTKCSVGGCGKEFVQLHHTVPFSMGGSNSPDLLRPLCREHHDILHSINSNYVRKKCEV